LRPGGANVESTASFPTAPVSPRVLRYPARSSCNGGVAVVPLGEAVVLILLLVVVLVVVLVEPGVWKVVCVVGEAAWP
jgi:hypothetical protein